MLAYAIFAVTFVVSLIICGLVFVSGLYLYFTQRCLLHFCFAPGGVCVVGGGRGGGGGGGDFVTCAFCIFCA